MTNCPGGIITGLQTCCSTFRRMPHTWEILKEIYSWLYSFCKRLSQGRHWEVRGQRFCPADFAAGAQEALSEALSAPEY